MPSGAWIASTTLSATQWAALRAGNYYFNVLSPVFPDGEVRGQLFRQLPAPEQLSLLQQRRQQSPQIERQVDAIRQIEDAKDWPRSGSGIGFSISF